MPLRFCSREHADAYAARPRERPPEDPPKLPDPPREPGKLKDQKILYRVVWPPIPDSEPVLRAARKSARERDVEDLFAAVATPLVFD